MASKGVFGYRLEECVGYENEWGRLEPAVIPRTERMHRYKERLEVQVGAGPRQKHVN